MTSTTSTATRAALAIDDLEVSYLVRGIHREVLRGVSLSVAPGEAYGLVGESGCGKSTTAYAALRVPAAQRRHHQGSHPRRRQRHHQAQHRRAAGISRRARHRWSTKTRRRRSTRRCVSADRWPSASRSSASRSSRRRRHRSRR